ncbi:hypothetical protein Hanom_Chr08g00744331 [Helianthus anomalus]
MLVVFIIFNLIGIMILIVALLCSLHLLLYTTVIQYMGHDPNLSSNYGFTQALEICLEKGSLSTVYICMIF